MGGDSTAHDLWGPYRGSKPGSQKLFRRMRQASKVTIYNRSMLKMPSCAAFNCNSRSLISQSGSTLHFFRFPLDDQARLQKWVFNVRRSHWNPNSNSRLCSQHFKDDCFYKDRKGNIRLSTSAVPTLFSFPCLQWKSQTTKIIQKGVNREHCYSLDLPTTQDIPDIDLQALDNYTNVGNDEVIDNTGAQVMSPNNSVLVDQTFGGVDDNEKASELGLSEDNEDQLHYIKCVTHDHPYFTDKHPCPPVEHGNFDKHSCPPVEHGYFDKHPCPPVEHGYFDKHSCPPVEHGYFVVESPSALKRRLDRVNNNLATCRKQLKLQKAKNTRLKQKVSALNSVIIDLKERLLIPNNNLMTKSLSQ